MDKLDLLKKEWQSREQNLPKVSQNDIYKMILKKSSTIVKWIFIISIAELLFWIGLNFIIPKENIELLGVTNIQMTIHNFVQSGFKSKFDVIVSNPPYIAINDMTNLQKEVRDYDPHSALTDYSDGLSFYRRFSEQFDNLLKPNGILILEIGGNRQKDDIEKIFRKTGLNVEFFKDLQRDWRVVEIRK